jgi:SAM-dependent methyltransferase
MKRLLFCLALFLAAPCAFSLSEDVPFVVTPDNVTLEMLKLANVGPKDYVIDLGSGDGRIVIVAAKRFGARGLGVEIVADLVKKSRENAKAAGVGDKVEFREEDLYKTDMSPATVITMYLLPEVNLQLRPKVLALAPGTRIVSHDWDMGDWKPDLSNTVIAPDKIVGRDKWSVVHLWIVPARIGGTWCRVGRAGQLDLQQKFQAITGAYSAGASKQELEGRIEGTRVITSDFELELKGGALRVARADKPFAALRGATFRPAAGGPCGPAKG